MRYTLILSTLLLSACANSISDSNNIANTSQFETLANEFVGTGLGATRIVVIRHKNTGNCYMYSRFSDGISLIEVNNEVCKK